MGHFLLSATEGEVILYDWSDEEWDWTWITCADLSKCSFNLYEVFTVTFYQSATHKIEQLVIIFARRMDDRKPTYTVMLCWLTEVFRTADSTENVTGTKNNSQLQLLDFQNKLETGIWNGHLPHVPVFRSPLHRRSYSSHVQVLLPIMHHSMCISRNIFRNPIIQRSSEQPSPTVLLTTAKCQHQAANTRINKK